MVSAEVLDFTLKGSIILLSKSPVDCICMNSVCNEELFCSWQIRASSNRWVCVGMERLRMNGTAQSLYCQKFRKGGIKIVGDEGGNGVLFAIGNDKEVVGASSIPIIVPSWAGKSTGLRPFWSWSGMFFICRRIHASDIELTATFIQD